MMIGRRALLVASLCAASKAEIRPAAALPVPPNGLLAFRLMRHGEEIGHHTLSFERAGDILTVRTEVTARVTLLSIPIVNYRHQVVETWRGETLISVTGETNKNGQHEWVKASRGGEGLVVTGSKTERYLAPEPARAATYWNRHVLDGPMISLEDGVLLRPKVAMIRTENIPLASGGTIPADRYNLSGPFAVDLWYDQSNTWASLALTAIDGSTVRYERL